MRKENIILVHSFPTNSIILKGLKDYLGSYFRIYFIDLPGFTKKARPLADITLENYSGYLDKKIKEIGIKNYVACGISFGFLVINNAELKGCSGILAIEPYLNSFSLRMKPLKKILCKLLSDSILFLGLENIMWRKNSIFHREYCKIHNHNHEDSIMFEQVDPKTFFKTAKLLLEDYERPLPHNLPYILMINKKDSVIRGDYTADFFKNRIKKLLIIDTDMDHYPGNLSKKYFRQKLPMHVIQKIRGFIN